MVLVLKKGASKKEIDAINQKLEKLSNNKKRFDAYKHCGVLKLAEGDKTLAAMLNDK